MLAPICTLRPLWRAVAVVTLSEKSIFNLRVNTVQPLLSTLGPFLVGGDFRFQLRQPIFSRAKLMRKLLRRLQRVSAVFFRNADRSVEHLQDRLPCFVELISAVRGRGSFGALLTGSHPIRDFRHRFDHA